MLPFVYTGKEVERRVQEGEDPANIENSGPVSVRLWTEGDPALIAKARRYGLRQLMPESAASQHATERFLNGERVNPATPTKLEAAAQKLEP